MAIFNDDKSKQDIFDLIEKFEKSSLFEFEIMLPVLPPEPQYTKIKMMKLSQDKPDEAVIKVKINDGHDSEELELKNRLTNE